MVTSTVRRMDWPQYSSVSRPEINAPIILPEGEYFEHTQISAAATWTIVHNLGRYPVVSIILGTGEVMFTDLVHSDANTVVATFAEPTSGRAILA